MTPEGEVILGDCLEVMATWPEASVDAIVTDPPYGLEFMGKEWDRGVAGVPFWREAFRIAKPSAYLLAFGGTRTVHRLASAIEDAGWIIRDTLVWAYAQGFPKSKASLKPAWEPIVMARKPGPLRMLNIDECRIGTAKDVPASPPVSNRGANEDWGKSPDDDGMNPNIGRWPANVILTDPIFDGDVAGVVGGGETAIAKVWGPSSGQVDGTSFNRTRPEGEAPFVYGDTGTYSRFFLVPKADRSDREPVLGGLSGLSTREHPSTLRGGGGGLGGEVPQRANVHPTVKPTELMRHLVRLVTPPGGLVLDPFLGSGTTALAAEQEGFRWVGIEREPEYVDIARARLNGTQRGLGLGA